MRRIVLLLCAGLIAAASPASQAALEVGLVPASTNPTSPRMGDRMKFSSVIRNDAARPAHGVVAWISLIQVDPGREQPVDLEDWSAHKAVTQALLTPGEKVTVEWPMRLIQAGDYRVVISALERGSPRIVTSPFVDFRVERKPVVESRRILPVVLGMPLLLAGLLSVRVRRRQLRRAQP